MTAPDAAPRLTLKSLADRLDAVDTVVSKMRPADTEARAMSLCVRALDEVPQRTIEGYSYSQRRSETDTPAVARVLDYLRQRYGLPDPNAEVRRLAERNERLEARAAELEHRLNTILGAAQVQS